MKHEKRFQVIADEAISKAEGIKCAGPEFVAGLELIVEAVKDRLAGVREEFKEEEE